MRLSYTEMPESTNVLTLIDRLDKQFCGQRRHYDSLCEITHPNADGLTPFGNVDHKNMSIALSESHESATFVVKHILADVTTLDVARLLLDRCRTSAPFVAVEAKYGQSPDNWADRETGA
jgi:hypothetical protein